MEIALSIIKQTRVNFNNLINGLSLEELNKVPAGFNNNIIWNYAHIIVTQQVICYRLSGLDLKIDAQFVDPYKKGTKPEAPVRQSQLDTLKEYSLNNIEELEKDLKNNAFSNFKPYMTSYGIELKTIEDAVKFLVVHEGLHIGYAMALKRLVKPA